MCPMVIGLALAYTGNATLDLVGHPPCEETGRAFYLLDLRSAEQVKGSVYKAKVLEAVRGEALEHLNIDWSLLIHPLFRDRFSAKEFLASVGRASVIVGEDSNLLLSPKCKPEVEYLERDEGRFGREFLATKTHLMLRQSRELKDVLTALRDSREGVREGAMRMLCDVDWESVPGDSWDAIGVATVEHLEQLSVEMGSSRAYEMLSVAISGSRRWRNARGQPPPAWLRRAGRVAFNRMEAGSQAQELCGLFSQILEQKGLCSTPADLRSSDVRLRIWRGIEGLPGDSAAP